MVITIVFLLMQIEIKAELNKKYINQALTIGDPFELTLTLTYPQDAHISQPSADSLEPFVILDQQHKTVQEEGVVTSTYEMRLAAFNTGELQFPALKFHHTHEDTVDTLMSNTVPIEITSVMPAGMEDINDIKEAIKFPNFLPLYIMGIIILCVVIGIFAYRFVKRLKGAATQTKPLPPPWIEAIAAIDSLPVKEWLSRRLFKKYYYALSEILKRYIERRFEFNAVEQTSTEIIEHLRLHKIPIREDFGRFFDRADLVKYAKYTPPQDELHTAAETVKTLVEKTKPPEAEESAR